MKQRCLMWALLLIVYVTYSCEDKNVDRYKTCLKT